MEFILNFLFSSICMATPLIFSSLGGLISEKSGVINIALDGMMLMGAFCSMSGALFFHSSAWGLVGGILGGGLLALLYGFLVIEIKAHQIIIGTAMNMLASGFTTFVGKILYDSNTSTPHLPLDIRFQIFPVILAWVCVLLMHFFFHHTPGGLWISFSGEHPEALDTSGISVNRTRWIAVLVSGMLAGLGGVSLSMLLSSCFSRGMTSGKGFIAIAAMIFGKWKPIPTAFVCLFFGFSETLETSLESVFLSKGIAIPVEFIQILPYVMTMIILSGIIGKIQPPSFLGIPFHKDEV